jgi:glycosyltransferase involved in cell wall biosynthesis
LKKKNYLEKIILVGFQKNIFNYLKNADLFILSSLWEDPGWVLIEAAASNTLILSSNCKNGPQNLLKITKVGYYLKIILMKIL